MVSWMRFLNRKRTLGKTENLSKVWSLVNKTLTLIIYEK